MKSLASLFLFLTFFMQFTWAFEEVHAQDEPLTVSDAERPQNQRTPEQITDDAWAEAEIPASPRFPVLVKQYWEGQRSLYFGDRTELYSNFHRAVEREMSGKDQWIDRGFSCMAGDGCGKPLFCKGFTRWHLVEVGNARWLEQQPFLSGAEKSLIGRLPILNRSHFFFEVKEQQQLLPTGQSIDSALRHRSGSGLFFSLFQGSSVRTEWKVTRLEIIRLSCFAPEYRVIYRHKNVYEKEVGDFAFEPDTPDSHGLSTAATNSLCAFERHAIRQLQRLNTDVVVDEHENEIHVVGAIRTAGSGMDPTNTQGPVSAPGQLFAVFSYGLTRQID